MSSTWSGIKWVWNERSFAHGQPARWLSAGHDRYKSWAIVESLLVFGGSLMPLLSLSNIANAQRRTIVKRRRKREILRVCVCVCVYVCETARGLSTKKKGERGRVVGLRWISGTHIYPSATERDTAIDGGTCEHGERVRKREVTDGIDSN